MTPGFPSLGVLPSGRLHWAAGDDSRMAAAFAASAAEGLLYLATAGLEEALPSDLAFARDLGRAYLTGLCRGTTAAPAEAELAERALAAPPMAGIEYLDAGALAGWWRDLDALVQDRMRASGLEPQAFLERLHPVWRLVGRVTFHLAENKHDQEHPFAFLATYTSRVSAQGKLQHQPLSHALREYAGAGNRAALAALLQPLQRAAEASAWVREMVDKGEVYHPLAWTPAQAYALLQAAAALEAAGVVVRLPNWWNAARPPRPRVQVRVGAGGGVKLGAGEMLDFSVDVAVEGGALTAAEIEALLAAERGLVSLRGQWVEVDADQLQAALRHWKAVERAHRNGVTFYEGMRLLAGVRLERDAEPSGGAAGSGALLGTADWSLASAGPALAATLEALRRPEAAAEDAHPPGLQAELRPYQAAGVGWLRLLTGLGLGACLADDMGLGKTIQVIALLLLRRRQRSGSPALLVVPASLIANWQAELERFAPELKIVVAHPSAGAWSLNDNAFDLAITTYSMLARLEDLRARRWPLLVLDEAQAIKNPGARQTQAAKAIAAEARIALTGTPIENRLGDLWSLFDFLNPGLLGDAAGFSRLEKRLASASGGDYGPLRRLVQPYILRRMKTDKSIARELPDKTEVTAYCGLSRRQAALYQRQVEALREALENAAEGSGIARRGLVLATLMRFKQICNHPSQATGDGGYAAEESGKFQRLAEICGELAERQEKALVFTQFREMTAPLAEFLAGVFGRAGLTLDGATPLRQRRERVAAFQTDDGPPFFVLSLKAGGTGLNLTAAAHVIHFDRWWNPAVEAQATDRAFRLGQKRNVLVHKFVCRGTVEDKIDAMLAQKRGLAERLIEGGGEAALTEIGDRELLQLVQLDLRSALAAEGAAEGA